MAEELVPDRPAPLARRAAVLGSPIAHSLSPALHRAAYAGLGLHWSYDAIDVDRAALPGFLAGLDDTWAGLSLTMPLKECVLDLLSEVDPAAERVGAVNTVLPGRHGWRGTNTDISGIARALEEPASTPPTTATVGGGATARSAIAALAARGLQRHVRAPDRGRRERRRPHRRSDSVALPRIRGPMSA
jgi:shikimate dehydrogenase